MKIKLLLLFLVLLPCVSFCQSINSPIVGISDDNSTTITKIDITKTNTVITFSHISNVKGDWVQLNKAIYLQDANGEDKYAYIKSEGIPLRPLQHIAAADSEILVFKVYFEKLKPGTKAINVIERALSPMDRAMGTGYFNYYNVSLENTDTIRKVKVRQVRLLPPDMASSSPTKGLFYGEDSIFKNIYGTMLDAQLKFYGDTTRLNKMAKITKSYYDALMNTGFTADQALKIITSQQFISMDGK